MASPWLNVDSTLDQILASAADEDFEDGVESEFSRALICFVRKHGRVAVEAIDSFIRNSKVSDEVAAEILRWLGHIDQHADTYSYRFYVLTSNLRHSSSIIRDGALLGLSFLDDPEATPHLRKAIAQEPYQELKEDMELILEQW